MIIILIFRIMKQETLEKAKRLEAQIHSAQTSIDQLRRVSTDKQGFVCFNNVNNVPVSAKLMKLLVDTAIDYKRNQMKEWKKELEEL